MILHLRPRIFFAYLGALILYAAFTLLPAPLPATLVEYHVSALELRLIDVTIILLSAIIWFAGFYGYERLAAYTRLIQTDKDGKQIAWLTRGIFALVIWLPVSSVVSSMLKFIAERHMVLMAATTIVDNYISLILPLVAFILINIGARGLGGLVRQRFKYVALNIMAIFLIYAGLIYYHLVASTYQRTEVYHLSLWLIILTLVAPYVYMWYVGLAAVYEIYHYRRKVAGIVYRRSWSLLALGLAWLLVASICFQFLTTLSARLASLPIYWILAIVYAVLLVLSVGFVLIALGAKKLQKIEEV